MQISNEDFIKKIFFWCFCRDYSQIFWKMPYNNFIVKGKMVMNDGFLSGEIEWNRSKRQS